MGWGGRRVREGKEGRGGERRGEEEGKGGEGKGREGKRKTKSGYAYVSAHRHTDRQTDRQTHRSENSISASFTPFTWRI